MENLFINEFRGVFPAVATPMTPEGKLNEAAFRQMIDFNINAGVDGFWIAGGSGESVLLDDEENNRIAEVVADQNRGRIKNIMHVGAPTTSRAAAMAEHAARAGVEAICCVPPFFYRRPDTEIVEHYRIIGEAADLPLFVYNLPNSTGVEITPDLMKRIQDRVPQLTGLKHSSVNFYNVRAFVKMGLFCFIGNSRLMLPALTIGAAGCVDGPPSLAPEMWVEIWRGYQAGELIRAEIAQDRASAFADELFSIGEFHAVLKATLAERIGIDCGSPRPPGLPLEAKQRAELKRVITRNGLTVR